MFKLIDMLQLQRRLWDDVLMLMLPGRSPLFDRGIGIHKMIPFRERYLEPKTKQSSHFNFFETQQI